VASRAVGDGGRGAGFIACATIKGMVGMLHDDTTGPSEFNPMSQKKKKPAEFLCSGTHLYNPDQ